jgi:hypothetical protein
LTNFNELRAEVLYAAKQHGIPPEKIKFDWYTLSFNEFDQGPVRAKRDSGGNIVLYIPALMFDRPVDPIREVLDYLACFKAAPKTLYVNRPLLNGKALTDWAKAQGFPTTLFDLHVTIAFSRAPVDWKKFTPSQDNLEIKGGERSVVALGETGDAAVLRFESADLTKRWNEFIDGGASWDWPSYQPHVTISFKAEGVDLAKVEPYEGTLVFGPEEFAEVKEDWKDTVAEKEFDEGKHPRDDHGRWTDGGGGDSESSGGEGKHPGEGYSAAARVINGVIHTSSVYDAQRALSENRKVELNQPRAVSVLLQRLGEVSKKMIAEGKEAPVFNLCNVSVKGTNLFCADTIGIPRVKMPQLDDQQTKDFRKYLKDQGYEIEKGKTKANNLRATQNELNGAKVAATAEKLRAKPDHYSKRIIVSKDDYILDGHHHWAAKIGLDAEDGDLTNDTKVKIARVNISITKLLAEAEKFTGGKGKVSVSGKTFTLGEIMEIFVRDFDESKHPRDESGKWIEGGGAGEGVSEEGVDEHGLSAKDRALLYDWMGSGYRHLRSDPSFAKVLEKLPKVNGKVFRGTRLKEEDLSKLKPGATYNIAKFSSSSQRRDVAMAFMTPAFHPETKKIPVFFEIDDSARKIPRPIATNAGTEEEAEVVIERGGKYKIKEITDETFSPGSTAAYKLVKMTEVHA